MKSTQRKIVSGLAIFVAGCLILFSIWEGSDDENSAYPNIIVLLVDDLGADWAPCYSSLNLMPNVQALCDSGVVFERAYSNPVCSTSRASILTGRYTLRTTAGAQGPVPGIERKRLPLREVIIPKALDDLSNGRYSHVAIGKWQLEDKFNGGRNNPIRAGFQNYIGSFQGSFFRFLKNEDGKDTDWIEKYRTTVYIDEAINWISMQEKPWFVWLAFNNVHREFHLPPNELHDFDSLDPDYVDWEHRALSDRFACILKDDGSDCEIDLSEDVKSPLPYFAAMNQALDTEIGRLLTYLDEEVERDTYVIFTSDNGTEQAARLSPTNLQRFKGTIYEGGVHVPLVISGPNINRPGRRVDSLVNLTDIFATTLELAVSDVRVLDQDRAYDSISLVPYLFKENQSDLRNFVYMEKGQEGREYAHAVSNGQFKLVVRKDLLELYDISADVNEEVNLLSTSPTELNKSIAAGHFKRFVDLYQSEEEPFTDIDIAALLGKYEWLALNSNH